MRISGPAEIGNVSTDIDLTLGELLDGLRSLFEGGFEVTNDQWSFELWSIYFDVGADAQSTILLGTRETDVDLRATVAVMTAAYRVGNWSLPRRGTATWGLDVLAGMIVYDLNFEVDSVDTVGLDFGVAHDGNWADFIVGGRLEFECSDRLRMSARGEIGGFGIGSSSDLAWTTTLLAEYQPARRCRSTNCRKLHLADCRLVAGFRYFEFDRQTVSGGKRVTFDWEIWGPIAGVNIYF